MADAPSAGFLLSAGVASTSTRLHVERNMTSLSSGRADSRASTAGRTSEPPANFSRTSTGAVRCDRPTTTITTLGRNPQGFRWGVWGERRRSPHREQEPFQYVTQPLSLTR